MYGWDVLITYLVRSGEKSSLKNIQKEKTVIKKKQQTSKEARSHQRIRRIILQRMSIV